VTLGELLQDELAGRVTLLIAEVISRISIQRKRKERRKIMSHCDSHCAHALKLEFVNEKYRDVLSQLELLSADNNALREQLNSLNSRMLQDPVKYLKLCEELTKVCCC